MLDKGKFLAIFDQKSRLLCELPPLVNPDYATYFTAYRICPLRKIPIMRKSRLCGHHCIALLNATISRTRNEEKLKIETSSRSSIQMRQTILQVFTFGCNDEGALGRLTEDDEQTYTPGKVEIPGKVVQVSAGDSHTVALTEDGRAFYWGTFRDNSGSFGLTTNGIEKLPIPLAPQLKIRKISSGTF